MKIATSATMRRIDEMSIAERGIAGSVLMDRAGKAVAREVMERFQPDAVAVLCGKGNNGGDGFVVARALHERGVQSVVFLLADPEGLKGDALDAFKKLPADVTVERPEEAHLLREQLIQFDLVVDALLGTGLRGPVTGFLAEAIEALNACETNVLSIDVPSGLMCEAEQTGGPCVRAQVTVTIGLPKLGLVVDPGVRSTGVVSVADIGFPSDLIEDASLTINLLTAEDMKRALPDRPPGGHKGTFGRVLILGGSEGMTGAAVLAARAAVRSGAGLVYAAYPRELTTIMESHLVEPVKRPLGSAERWFTSKHAKAALREAAGMQAVALGPGLGQRKSTGEFVEQIVEGVDAPLVIDADGLNLLSGGVEILSKRPGPTVLTPHPAEAARLLGLTTEQVQSDRLKACRALAKDLGVVVVLKGAQTVITAPDEQRYINPTGNSGLAKGGSGDVLTGLIAGLIAQGCSPLAGAQLGVFLHGLAADRAAIKTGVRALTPSDLIEAFGEAFLYLERGGDH